MVVNGQSENHRSENYRSVVCFGTNSALSEFPTDFMCDSPKGQEKLNLVKLPPSIGKH